VLSLQKKAKRGVAVPAPSSQALLVLGMHRSGTSALTGMLELLGITLAGELLAEESYNEKGLFENKRINLFHERLLGELQSSWDDPLPLSPDWLRSATGAAALAEALTIIEEDLVSAAQLFAVKDPRMCRFLPLWQKALEATAVQPAALLCLRHPDEVSASLQRRDGFPRLKSLLLWLTYSLDAEHGTRQMPRSVVLYDDLLADWRVTERRIATDLNLVWPIERVRVEHKLDDFLSSDLRHHTARIRTADGNDPLHQLCLSAWQILRDMQNSPADTSHQKALDAIREQLNHAGDLLGPLVSWGQQTHRSLGKDLADARWMENELRKSLGELEQSRAEVTQNWQNDNQRLESELKAIELERAREQADLADKLSAMERDLELRQADLSKSDIKARALAENIRIIELAKRETELKSEDLAAKITSLEQSVQSERERNALLAAQITRERVERGVVQTPAPTASTSAHAVSASPTSLTSAPVQLQSERAEPMRPEKFMRNALPALKQSARRLPILRRFARSKNSEIVTLLRSSPLFDSRWYLETYPDVAATGADPVEHYVEHGAAEGRDPGPSFNAKLYLARYPDVAASNANPLQHYILHGSLEGRVTVSYAVSEASDKRQAASIVQNRFSNLRPLPLYRIASPVKRLTMVTDSINAGSLYGGVGTAMIVAAKLARLLGRRLRIVTRTEAPLHANFGNILRIQQIAFDENVEFAFADVNDPNCSIDSVDDELFLTTSWWTTYSVKRAVAPEKIIYLLQEDERMFYPLGDDYLRCHETISDPNIRYLINSKLLFDTLTDDGFDHLHRKGAYFEPAFPSEHYFWSDSEGSTDKLNLFFYARPHNVRNLYYRGLEVIDAALSRGIIDPSKWNINVVGKDLGDLVFAGGVKPTVRQNMTWQEYTALMRATDLGLSLMYTPHPSYPPLDLAACGAVAVTNQFARKTSLSRYSDNIICVPSTLDGLLDGLRSGVELASDRRRRRANYDANTLNRDWDAALDDALATVAGGI